VGTRNTLQDAECDEPEVSCDLHFKHRLLGAIRHDSRICRANGHNPKPLSGSGGRIPPGVQFCSRHRTSHDVNFEESRLSGTDQSISLQSQIVAEFLEAEQSSSHSNSQDVPWIALPLRKSKKPLSMARLAIISSGQYSRIAPGQEMRAAQM
jgi:hypothetical protein